MKYTIIIFIIANFSWGAEIANNKIANSSSTQSYSSNSDTDEVPAQLQKNDVEADLCDPKTVRFQLLEDICLGYNDQLKQQLIKSLTAPVLCIGTGHNRLKISLAHPRPTIVHDCDFTIDASEFINPDLSIDAFKLTPALSERIGKERYSSIFFAHIGCPSQIILAEGLKISLTEYFFALREEGFFVYESAVYIPAALQENNVDSDFSDIDSLGQAWTNVLTAAGFSDVVFFTKDESKKFIASAISIVVMARKSSRS